MLCVSVKSYESTAGAAGTGVAAATGWADGATTPIYISAILILSSFAAMCGIPIETRGAQIL